MLMNFSWLVDGVLAGAGQLGGWGPRAGEELERDLEQLRREGIGALVSLTEAGLEARKVEGRQMRYLHLPIADMRAPTVGDIETFVDFVESAATEGRAVLVHCGAGMGRTGTMLAAYLIEMGATPAEAIARVRQQRPGSIETPEQEMVLYEYASRRGQTS